MAIAITARMGKRTWKIVTTAGSRFADMVAFAIELRPSGIRTATTTRAIAIAMTLLVNSANQITFLVWQTDFIIRVRHYEYIITFIY